MGHRSDKKGPRDVGNVTRGTQKRPRGVGNVPPGTRSRLDPATLPQDGVFVKTAVPDGACYTRKAAELWAYAVHAACLNLCPGHLLAAKRHKPAAQKHTSDAVRWGRREGLACTSNRPMTAKGKDQEWST